MTSRVSTLTVAISLLVVGVVLKYDRALAAEPSDRALAQSIALPGAALDPVLSALADGRLVRNVAAPLAGQVRLPAVPLGFGLTGDQLLPLDVTHVELVERQGVAQ
jgi:hypothetical protein